MIATFALALVLQAAPAPPPAISQDQANGQAAIEGMVQIFTTLGSCERHFTPDQIRGIRRALEPQAGATQTPLQAYIDNAYQRGKADTSRSARFCQEVLKMLAEAQSDSR